MTQSPPPPSAKLAPQALLLCFALVSAFAGQGCRDSIDGVTFEERPSQRKAVRLPPSDEKARKHLEAACTFGSIMHSSAEHRSLLTPEVLATMPENQRGLAEVSASQWKDASNRYGEQISALSRVPQRSVEAAASRFRSGALRTADASLLAVLETVMRHQAKSRSGSRIGKAEWEQDYATLYLEVSPGQDSAAERISKIFDED